MDGGSAGPAPCVIVVGDRRSELVRQMVRLARACAVEAVPCDNVWTAVVETARASCRRVLVVGTLAELSREDGRFFRIARTRHARCCCILGEPAMQPRASLLQALRSGAAIMTDADMPGALERWLAAGDDAHWFAGPPNLSDDEMRPTREELIALFGPERDV